MSDTPRSILVLTVQSSLHGFAILGQLRRLPLKKGAVPIRMSCITADTIGATKKLATRFYTVKVRGRIFELKLISRQGLPSPPRMHSRQPPKHQRVDRRTVAKASQSKENAG